MNWPRLMLACGQVRIDPEAAAAYQDPWKKGLAMMAELGTRSAFRQLTLELLNELCHMLSCCCSWISIAFHWFSSSCSWNNCCIERVKPIHYNCSGLSREKYLLSKRFLHFLLLLDLFPLFEQFVLKQLQLFSLCNQFLRLKTLFIALQNTLQLSNSLK